MEDRQWMYTGRSSQNSLTDEWINKTDAFLERAFARIKGGRDTWCPCRKCGNLRRQTKLEMGKHLVRHGFTPDYTIWIYHGEFDRGRDEVIRQRIEQYDDDAGVGDMLDDYHEARREEEPEATAKAYYDMLCAAQQPLHGHTKVSQLDAIARLMAVKSQFSLSRNAFDVILTVFGSLLPEDHILPKSMYEAQKLLRIRARSTDSSPAIRARPTAAQLQMQALQAQVEVERKHQEELEARIEQMFQYMQSNL
ncbi:uncharacterized protein [Setaria viridis]|uniref:uncharacterized protein n=1 Tax=Setaria viridis TaxID=4556 RepID=UPI003B3B5FD1